MLCSHRKAKRNRTNGPAFQDTYKTRHDKVVKVCLWYVGCATDNRHGISLNENSGGMLKVTFFFFFGGGRGIFVLNVVWFVAIYTCI